ncbi:hypothetical protein [Nostoc sp.]
MRSVLHSTQKRYIRKSIYLIFDQEGCGVAGLGVGKERSPTPN